MATETTFGTVGIVGLGLMGGSLAAAAGRLTPRPRIVAVDPSPETRHFARAEGLVDEIYHALHPDLQGCDLVVLAAPIDRILDLLPRLGRLLAPGTVVTDLGSTKERIVAAARRALPASLHFIGGHPMTGGEKPGLRHFDPYLFENALYVLTEDEEDLRDEAWRAARDRLAGWLRALGARTLFMGPGEHDRAAATVSHLPHLLAVSLVLTARHVEDSGAPCAALAAGGFRDVSRIAESGTAMWRSIYDSNREALLGAVQTFRGILDGLVARIEAGEALDDILDEARAFRRSLPLRSKGFLDDLVDVRVVVEDRPGVLAGIAAALMMKGINIRDVEVLKIREGEGGTLRLAFRDVRDATTAVEVLRALQYTCWMRT